MIKNLSFIIYLISASIIITGCSNQSINIDQSDAEENIANSSSKEETIYPIKKLDASGRYVILNEEPQTIISLIPSNTEIVYALGAGDLLVGRTEFDDYPEEVIDVQSVGGMEFDVEQIINLDPDLILAHESGIIQAEHAFEQLEKAEYPVFIVKDTQTIESVYESIETISELLNRKTEAKQIINHMTTTFAQLEDMTSKNPTDQRSVWVEISPQPLFVAGTETFLDELLSVGHAKNAADDQSGWVELSEEVGITYDPDVIISTYDGAEAIKERPAWNRVKAVEQDRVFNIDTNLVSRPGPRLAEGALKLAELVYPEDFE